jgi:hypothetical protein
MRTISKLTVLLLLIGTCMAAPAPSDGEPVATPKHAKKAEKRAASAEEVKQLREMIQAQQAQIDQLKQQVAQRDQTNQQAATDAEKSAAAAQQQAAAAASAAADSNAKVNAVQSDVAGLTTTVNTTVVTVQKDEKRVADLEEPAYVHYKGVKLTPGGYAQFATIYRAHNANSDTADLFGQYTFPNSPNYHMSEFRATGRASRFWLKAQGEAHGMKFMSYAEMDFLGAAGGNETQTNSFAPRLRLAFANVDLPGGWSIAAGQNWSMIQTTRKGIDPLSEWLPAVIDNSYTPGFAYAREGTIRVVKQITPQAWFGFSLENPDTVSAGGCASAACTFTGPIQGLANSTSTTAPNSGYLNATSGAGTITGNPSTNPTPDLVAKFAFEPGWGHYEVKAIGRWFRDRVYPDYFGTAPTGYTSGENTFGGVNKTTEGGGIGFGAILPIVKDKVDIDFQGLAGAGIGRFSPTSGPDVTFNRQGALVPVKAVQAVLGIETHPTPKFDFDVYGGGEYYRRVQYFLPAASNFFGETTTSATEIGYGAQDFSDKGCKIEGSSCSGLTKTVWAVQPQLWYRLYKGSAGTLQFGASYAYVWREAWAGVGPGTTGTLPALTGLVSPKTINQIVLTAFRYYLP